VASGQDGFGLKKTEPCRPWSGLPGAKKMLDLSLILLFKQQWGMVKILCFGLIDGWRAGQSKSSLLTSLKPFPRE
jgi:hypothetical protein